MDFADTILSQAKELGLRVGMDNDNESVGKKIRNAELAKIPYTLVIGEKEVESKKTVPRVRSDMEVSKSHDSHSIGDILKTIQNEAKSRVSKSSL